jgi:ubiquinone/menaquinone biosynthesis C-methylase UbiE
VSAELSRPTRTHFEVLREALELAGATVIDVGCGAGALSRRLAGAAAEVIGVDPSHEAIARAQSAAGPSERYLLGTAEALPLASDAGDIVTFLNSLHHVSPAALMQALAETARVLRPHGILYVQEPLAEGRYFEIVRLVEDETEVRAAAQAALANCATAGLRLEAKLEYDAVVRHRDFEAFRDAVLLADGDRADLFAARAREIEPRFHAAAERDERGYTFRQPTRVTVLRPLGEG